MPVTSPAAQMCWWLPSGGQDDALHVDARVQPDIDPVISKYPSQSFSHLTLLSASQLRPCFC